MPSATGKYLRQVVFFCGMGHCVNLLCHKPSGGCTRLTEEGICAAVRRRAKSGTLPSGLRGSRTLFFHTMDAFRGFKSIREIGIVS